MKPLASTSNPLAHAVGSLLVGDPLPLAGLAGHPLAFQSPARDLLEAVAPILRETNDIATVCEGLEARGRPELAALLLELATQDVIETDRCRPWASAVYMRQEEEADPRCDLYMENLSAAFAKAVARDAVRVGARVLERRSR